MNNRLMALVAAALIGSTALLQGCSDDVQERYDEATAALEQAREKRNQARENVTEKQKELQALQAKLDDAEDDLEEAREQLNQAEAFVNKNVTDEVLFRSIQRKLLDEERFGDAAIAVGVSDRVVTLTGTAPDSKTHKAALKMASNQSGVKEVVDFIEVAGKTGKAKPRNEGE